MGLHALGILGMPLGLAISGSETRDSIAGALVLAAIAGLVGAPWVVRAWQGWMAGQALKAAAAATGGDIRHDDGERGMPSLPQGAPGLDAFQTSGLVVPFVASTIRHVLSGHIDGVPFMMSELRLADEKGLRAFSGVLAGFLLQQPHPGLTIVSREAGLLGNLVARFGSALEPVTLEDPHFEGIFEAYSTDQVDARVILTTTMLERLKALDELGHAKGFTCAFHGNHLLVAFPGMTWRCGAHRFFQPSSRWLDGYRAWIEGLIRLPAEVVAVLGGGLPARRAAPAPQLTQDVSLVESSIEDLGANAIRLVGAAGLPLVYIASGSLFGGLAASGAHYGLTEGFMPELRWYFTIMVLLGLAYGAYAILWGVSALAKLAWGWNAPLRSLPAATARRRPIRR
jgi:hypothetical protein